MGYSIQYTVGTLLCSIIYLVYMHGIPIYFRCTTCTLVRYPVRSGSFWYVYTIYVAPEAIRDEQSGVYRYGATVQYCRHLIVVR